MTVSDRSVKFWCDVSRMSGDRSMGIGGVGKVCGYTTPCQTHHTHHHVAIWTKQTALSCCLSRSLPAVRWLGYHRQPTVLGTNQLVLCLWAVGYCCRAGTD